MGRDRRTGSDWTLVSPSKHQASPPLKAAIALSIAWIAEHDLVVCRCGCPDTHQSTADGLLQCRGRDKGFNPSYTLSKYKRFVFLCA